MKIFRLLILLTVLGLAAFWQITPPSPSVEEGANVFGSPFYPEYHRQLKSFIDQHPAKDSAPELAAVLEKPVENQRLRHESFVLALRQRLNEQTGTPFINDLVAWIYLKSTLTTATEHYFYSAAPQEEKPVFSSLIPIQKKLRKEGHFTGLKHQSPY